MELSSPNSGEEQGSLSWEIVAAWDPGVPFKRPAHKLTPSPSELQCLAALGDPGIDEVVLDCLVLDQELRSGCFSDRGPRSNGGTSPLQSWQPYLNLHQPGAHCLVHLGDSEPLPHPICSPTQAVCSSFFIWMACASLSLRQVFSNKQ